MPNIAFTWEDIYENKFPEFNKVKYEYILASFTRYRDKMLMVCPIHGYFWQRPSDHARGYGCRKCGSQSTGDKLRKKTEEFIIQAKKVHGNKFCYSKVVYVNGHTPVIVICPIHGEFLVKPVVHLKGSDCPKCERENHIYTGGIGQYNEAYFERNPEMKDHFGLLYLIKIKSLDVLKLGITKDESISKRFSSLRRDTNSEIEQVNLYVTTLYDAFKKEQELLKRYKNKRLSLDVDFSGKTECFPSSMEDRLVLEISCLIEEKELNNPPTEK